MQEDSSRALLSRGTAQSPPSLHAQIEPDGKPFLMQEVDNDVETDEELAGREVERCKAWLMQAVQQQNHPQS